MAHSQPVIHIPDEQQYQLVLKAIEGDTDARDRLLDLYTKMINYYSYDYTGKRLSEDIKSELTIYFLDKIILKLKNVQPHAYRAYTRKCLKYKRIEFLNKQNPQRHGFSTENIDILPHIEKPRTDTNILELIYHKLKSNPDDIYNTSLVYITHTSRFAQEMGVTSRALRKFIIDTIKKTNPSKNQINFIFGQFGKLLILTDEEIEIIKKSATTKQQKALRLYTSGYNLDEIGNTMNTRCPSYLLKRLVKQIEHNFTPLPICQYFQRLSRNDLKKAICLATPKELVVLQRCLLGENLNQIVKSLKLCNRSHARQFLQHLQKRIERSDL